MKYKIRKLFTTIEIEATFDELMLYWHETNLPIERLPSISVSRKAKKDVETHKKA